MVPGGVELQLLVQPRASRNQVMGEHGGRLKVALVAAPVDGKANAALIDFLAQLLLVKRAQIILLDGLSGRRKRIQVAGIDAAAVKRVIS